MKNNSHARFFVDKVNAGFLVMDKFSNEPEDIFDNHEDAETYCRNCNVAWQIHLDQCVERAVNQGGMRVRRE